MTRAPDHRAAKRAEVAERRTKAIRLHLAGLTFQQIADQLGYSSRQVAGKDVARALEELKAEQHKAAEEWRAVELARLDQALAVAIRVMNEQHVAHSGGSIVMRVVDGEEVPVVDNGPSLAAVDRVVKISESRRKLLGLDAPAKQEIVQESTVHFAVVGVPAEELDAL
jgi:hypothetical protein